MDFYFSHFLWYTSSWAKLVNWTANVKIKFVLGSHSKGDIFVLAILNDIP